jgi:hypothetical protein
MRILGQAADRQGRVWQARIVAFEEAEDENWRFWHEELTPEQRIVATLECRSDCLKAEGTDELRIRGVSRVVQREER